MAHAKLKFDGREINIGAGVTTLGRASDNAVSFVADSNVSRYHADIEERGGAFWLTELGSSNGTTVNGERVEAEKLLNDGDVVLLGGSSQVEFSIEKEFAEKDEEQSAADGAASSGAASVDTDAEIAEDTPASSKLPLILGLMGVVCGLAIICVVGVFLFSYFSKSSKCEATAKIVKPDNQDTINKPTEIEAEAENADCVRRAIFLINGVEFADTDEQPYKVTLDPKNFPELANGGVQSIQIVLEDADGSKIVQPDDFALALETSAVATPSPTPEEVAENPTPNPKTVSGKKITLSETQDAAKKIVSQFSSSNVKYNYKTSDPQFLEEVQKKTAEMVSEGYFARAQKYKDVINVAFVQNEGLDAPLGYLLAMSRSQFNPQKQNGGVGLWQMNPDFAAANSYTQLCGTQTLADASQECAAKAAALYLKSLVTTVFEGDVVYEVAAFGMTTQEANIWKASLPADRSDFWNVIKNSKQRDAVAGFFAAGIVAENPQKFGLKNDRPISQLYP